MNKAILRGAAIALAMCLASPALTACGGSKSDDKKTDVAATASSGEGGGGSGGTDGTGGGTDASASPGGSSSPKPEGSLKASKLPVPEDLAGALQDTYFAAAKKNYPKGTRANVMTPQHVLFGKVTGKNGGVEFYAAGDIGFKNDPMSQQDGPHVWKKDDSQQSWAYVGDTGGALCGKVPTALVKAWGKSCN
ncbi:hypothetical protein [Actinomadura harenae]|uniref:Lipoprotein n=1 Tax=Actinomadura harenae TaxID=2483351 RepID=A0A3M2LKG9_9ACTN|nr:hypothetical protein [Actinomadura harenae]RMI37606.1 hypothetical protein EBO15_35465 [Actinomadura harenae]